MKPVRKSLLLALLAAMGVVVPAYGRVNMHVVRGVSRSGEKKEVQPVAEKPVAVSSIREQYKVRGLQLANQTDYPYQHKEKLLEQRRVFVLRMLDEADEKLLQNVYSAHVVLFDLLARSASLRKAYKLTQFYEKLYAQFVTTHGVTIADSGMSKEQVITAIKHEVEWFTFERLHMATEKSSYTIGELLQAQTDTGLNGMQFIKEQDLFGVEKLKQAGEIFTILEQAAQKAVGQKDIGKHQFYYLLFARYASRALSKAILLTDDVEKTQSRLLEQARVASKHVVRSSVPRVQRRLDKQVSLPADKAADPAAILAAYKRRLKVVGLTVKDLSSAQKDQVEAEGTIVRGHVEKMALREKEHDAQVMLQAQGGDSEALPTELKELVTALQVADGATLSGSLGKAVKRNLQDTLNGKSSKRRKRKQRAKKALLAGGVVVAAIAGLVIAKSLVGRANDKDSGWRHWVHAKADEAEDGIKGGLQSFWGLVTGTASNVFNRGNKSRASGLAKRQPTPPPAAAAAEVQATGKE